MPRDRVAHERNQRSWDPELATTLRDARLRSQRSLRQVAQSAGVAFGYLGQLERNERTPSVVVAGRLAVELRLDAVQRVALEAGAVRGVGYDHPKGKRNRRG